MILVHILSFLAFCCLLLPVWKAIGIEILTPEQTKEYNRQRAARSRGKLIPESINQRAFFCEFYDSSLIYTLNHQVNENY